MILRVLLWYILIVATCMTAYAQKVKLLQQGRPTSIRGLSVVNNDVAWISGSKGYVAITHDGGKSWDWQQIKGYEQADFRDIEAFSDKEAIVMSSGTPALILKTIDGGQSWQLKYRNDDKSCFLDAMDFNRHRHGLILGDPINGKFLLLETNDGGETWHKFNNLPAAIDGEAAFAASGTCLRMDRDNIGFVTGGKTARYITFNAVHKKWSSLYLPMKHGKDSQGIFSYNAPGFVFVGGDYANPQSADSTSVWYNPALVSIKDGWALSDKGTGYQSCVEYVADKVNLSTGTSGSNISTDGGRTWSLIDGVSFNVCRKAKQGKLVLLAGDKGAIGKLEL